MYIAFVVQLFEQKLPHGLYIGIMRAETLMLLLHWNYGSTNLYTETMRAIYKAETFIKAENYWNRIIDSFYIGIMGTQIVTNFILKLKEKEFLSCK